MKKKIKILAIVQNPGAVAQVRIISPLNYLNKKNHLDFEVVDLSQEENNVVNYVPDIVILQRINNLSYYDFIKLLKSKGSKIIFELDDNLLELPPKNPAFSLYSDPIQRRGFLEYLWLADHITVSTENLKHYYSRFNKSITVIPNQIDEEIFDNNSIRITNKSKVRIGFAGTTTHQEDFEQVIPALKRITENYKNIAELVFINMIPKDFIEHKTVKYIPGTGYLSSFAKLLIESRIDIGLAPLSFNRFNMAKSDIKFLEYAKSGIAGIYSNFGPYKRSIIDDENGLLINFENSNEWFYKLEHLINNPNKIDIIKKNALKYVNCNRTIAQNHRNWLNVYLELLGNSKKSEINQNIKIEEKTVYTVNKHKNYQLVDKSPKASFIILTHNQKKYTQECIESIYKNTKVNYELILIDNNSTDETKKYLEELQTQKKNLKVIFNKENKGFPAGINQGILEAKTENIIIANNDIVVTENWLEKMIQKAESDSEIGIVGPISNSVSGVQLDKNAKYNSIEEMHKYAEISFC
jgi:glycosyltransferase involved in cell wall biosynthesis